VALGSGALLFTSLLGRTSFSFSYKLLDLGALLFTSLLSRTSFSFGYKSLSFGTLLFKCLLGFGALLFTCLGHTTVRLPEDVFLPITGLDRELRRLMAMASQAEDAP
jgi:hypothetical protein